MSIKLVIRLWYLCNNLYNPVPQKLKKEENDHNKQHNIIYIYLFVVYARNARTHKSGPREAQMFASNFCAHFVLVTIWDLKIKLHIFLFLLLEMFCRSCYIKVIFECIIKGRKVFLFLYLFDVIKSKKMGWWIVFF